MIFSSYNNIILFIAKRIRFTKKNYLKQKTPSTSVEGVRI